jgi:hypothetical protein
MREIKTTPNYSFKNENEMLKFRELTSSQVEELIEYWGSNIYNLLYRIDLISICYNEEFELFIEHTYELFNDYDFNELLENFESTSEFDEGIYETQIIF